MSLYKPMDIVSVLLICINSEKHNLPIHTFARHWWIVLWQIYYALSKTKYNKVQVYPRAFVLLTNYYLYLFRSWFFIRIKLLWSFLITNSALKFTLLLTRCGPSQASWSSKFLSCAKAACRALCFITSCCAACHLKL